MSFSWVGNAWSGPANEFDYFPSAITYTGGPKTASLVSNFPTAPLMSQNIPQSGLGMYDLQVPTYLLLKDMAANKTPLVFQRGGYQGLPPTVEPLAKCANESTSGQFYCTSPPVKPSAQLLGVYGP